MRPRRRAYLSPMRYLLYFPLLCLLACEAALDRNEYGVFETTVLSNLTPRLTGDGEIVDAHDGRVIQFGDRYYWYGTAYGETNGFTPANTYVSYSSPDLKTWTYEGPLLPERPEGVYYRPHVVHNVRTGKYVLWYNWYPKLWEGQFGVATSDTPAGPFTILSDDVPVSRSAEGVGDLGVFVDDDGTAYLSYNTINNHRVSIERLDADYTGSTLENGGIIAEHAEAGAQFKRDGKYYLLTDVTCCFCNYGSGARVYMSDDPISDYRFTGNINRHPGRPAPGLTDGVRTGTDYTTLQRRDTVFEAVEWRSNDYLEFDRVLLTLFTGNRPENCGDASNPRVHAPYTAPRFTVEAYRAGEWETLSVIDTAVATNALNQTVALQLPPTSAYRLRVRPDTTHAFGRVFVSELALESATQAVDWPADARAYVTGPGIPRRPIIPAQQSFVLDLGDDLYSWQGDMWGSASDNVKGHDYQYWSAPLRFREDGTIAPLAWVDEWAVAAR